MAGELDRIRSSLIKGDQTPRVLTEDIANLSAVAEAAVDYFDLETMAKEMAKIGARAGVTATMQLAYMNLKLRTEGVK